MFALRYLRPQLVFRRTTYSDCTGRQNVQMVGCGNEAVRRVSCAWSRIHVTHHHCFARSWTMGHTVDDQQLGCLCIGQHQLSVSLSGSISYLDANNPSAPIRTINGHNKPITAMAFISESGRLFTADSNATCCTFGLRYLLSDPSRSSLVSGRWNTSTGSALRLRPSPHKSQIVGLDCHAQMVTAVSCPNK